MTKPYEACTIMIPILANRGLDRLSNLPRVISKHKWWIHDANPGHSLHTYAEALLQYIQQMSDICPKGHDKKQQL